MHTREHYSKYIELANAKAYVVRVLMLTPIFDMFFTFKYFPILTIQYKTYFYLNQSRLSGAVYCTYLQKIAEIPKRKHTKGTLDYATLITSYRGYKMAADGRGGAELKSQVRALGGSWAGAK